jgi:hypothetical protein
VTATAEAAADFIVIVPRLRGYGGSENPPPGLVATITDVDGHTWATERLLEPSDDPDRAAVVTWTYWSAPVRARGKAGQLAHVQAHMRQAALQACHRPSLAFVAKGRRRSSTPTNQAAMAVGARPVEAARRRTCRPSRRD